MIVACLGGWDPGVGQFSSIDCVSRWLLPSEVYTVTKWDLSLSYLSIGVATVLPIHVAGAEVCEYFRLVMRLELPVSCQAFILEEASFFCFYIYFKYILKDICSVLRGQLFWLCVCMCTIWVLSAYLGQKCVSDLLELQWWTDVNDWGMNLGLLQEQQVLLRPELPLNPLPFFS